MSTPTLGRTAPAAVPAPRLVSVDAVRGLAVVGMLLVNNADVEDAIPAQLRHGAGGRCTSPTWSSRCSCSSPASASASASAAVGRTVAG